MGVIYKLNDKVVEYIVAQKKRQPSLSCRTMVDLIKKDLDLKVSKSSINDVFKAAHLSNPVGRPLSTEPKARKFTIPSAKKDQLFKRPQGKAGPTVKKQAVIKKPAAPEAPKSKPSVSKITKTVDKGVLYDGMGCFFLKAAEWALAEDSIMGDVVAKYTEGFSREEVRDACETLLYFEVFGIKETKDIMNYTDKGLWVLNGIKKKMDYQTLVRITEGVKDIRSFNVEMSNLMAQILHHVSLIKITLKNNEAVFIDAQATTVWTNNVQTNLVNPSQKALDLMSKLIVNNLSPLIFCAVPGVGQGMHEFVQLAAAFEGLKSEGIQSIVLIDEDQTEIAEFPMLPDLKRQFIAGAWPWQAVFKIFEEEGRDIPIHEFYHQELNKQVFYSESYSNAFNEYTDQPLPPMRVFLIRESEDGEVVVAVITNISAEDMAPQEVIRSYLLRWPNLQRGGNIVALRQPQDAELAETAGFNERAADEGFLNEAKGSLTLRANFQQVLRVLHRYCQQRFFPYHYDSTDITQLISRIYSLPGYVQKMDQCLIIRLVLPSKEYAYKEDLDYSVKRFNEADVQDLQGRKILIFIDER